MNLFEQNPEQLSDSDLVRLCLERQPAFLFVIQRYKVKLFNYIRRISNVGSEDAEDLLQEIFIKVYLNLNGFDPDLKFSSWIYSIARNQVISNHRKIQSRGGGYNFTLDDEMVKNLVDGLDAQANVDTTLLKEAVQKVLSGLADKYREVLVLKYLEDKNYQEISDIIQKPTGTVASMINRAKQLFREELIKQNIKF